MPDPMEQTNSGNAFEKQMNEDEHPLDKSLGDIHEISLALAYTGQYRWAEKLAKAHETIQNYLIKKDI